MIKRQKSAISLHHIEPDAEMKFSKTDRAQMKGPRVAFVQMVGTIHETLEVNTMLQLKHVARLVSQNFATPLKQNFLIILSGFLSVEDRIVPGEAENPDAIAKRGLAEDEIP